MTNDKSQLTNGKFSSFLISRFSDRTATLRERLTRGSGFCNQVKKLAIDCSRWPIRKKSYCYAGQSESDDESRRRLRRVCDGVGIEWGQPEVGPPIYQPSVFEPQGEVV